MATEERWLPSSAGDNLDELQTEPVGEVVLIFFCFRTSLGEMSVPAYTEIIERLHGCLIDAIQQANAELRGRSVSIDENVALVKSAFIDISDGYLNGLAPEALYGALVSLREYGRRNQDRMITLIEKGSYPEILNGYPARRAP